jgi:hypothetical protein
MWQQWILESAGREAAGNGNLSCVRRRGDLCSVCRRAGGNGNLSSCANHIAYRCSHSLVAASLAHTTSKKQKGGGG